MARPAMVSGVCLVTEDALGNRGFQSPFAVLPRRPFKDLGDGELIRCFEALVDYFRSKGFAGECPEDSAHDVLTEAVSVSPANTRHFLAWRAYRHFCTLLRVRARRPRQEPLGFHDLPVCNGRRECSYEEDVYEALRQALTELCGEDRALVERHYFDNDTQLVLSRRLGVSAQAVSVRLKKIRAQLRRRVQQLLD